MSGYQGIDNLYMNLGVEEKIPEALRLKQIKSSSIVKERRNARFVPIGSNIYQYGTAAGFNNSSNIISFRITDSNSYLDLQSCYLNFNVVISESGTRSAASTGVEYTVPEDGIGWVPWSRGRVLCNSVLVEDIAQLNSLTSALIYANCSQQTYNKQLGTLAGAWKFNTDISTANGYDNTAVLARRKAFGQVLRNAAVYNTISVSVPLSLLFDFFRESKYFPLRNAGHIALDLYVDDIRNYFLAAANNAGGVMDIAVQYSNMFISCDMLGLDPGYVSAMDRIMMSQDPGEGFKMALNTFLVADAQYQTTTTHSSKSVVYSKSTPQLRSILFWKRNPADSNNSTRTYVNNFERLDQGHPINSLGTSIRIGSEIFPVNPMYTVAEHMRELVKSYGGFSMLSSSLLVLPNFCNSYGADVASTDAGCNNTFLWGYNFDKVQGLQEEVHLDGLDASVASLISVQFSDQAAAARTETMTAAIQYTRYLVISGNQVQMLGM